MTKRVYTVPPDCPFLDRLAEGLWKQAGHDPFKLADMLVLLPTRRACRNLREAFAGVTGTTATLLPRMQALGDIDEDELYFSERETLDPAIPPAISPLRRQLLLTQLIRKKDSEIPLDQAAQLADALGKFLDEVQIEQCSLAALDKIVPQEFAEHWQLTLEFLKILSDAWPAVLASESAIDPKDHRNRIIEAQTAVWRAKPPQHPVIAAGSTASQPATAELLTVVAGLPHGAVILPGLDQDLDEAAWQAIKETHPQYGMKQWLERTAVARDDVKLWPACSKKHSARVRLLQEAMRPVEVTEQWRHLESKKFPRAALKGISRLMLDNARQEAQAIALIMRGALETEGKTAALVTLDRDLAGRVAQELARWGIAANDSAGTALAALPAGSFLLDVLAAARPEASPVDYLALFKHPLAACGLAPAACRAKAREAEIRIWRNGGRKQDSDDIARWFAGWKDALGDLTSIWRTSLPLSEWIERHRKLAERIAASDMETGGDRVWKNEAGEAAAAWLDHWRDAADGFPPLDGEDYLSLCDNLLRMQVVRPAFGWHPRLNIWGPLEARLNKTDLVILGGLNENSWPPQSAVDPWMSRPMKETFGLPLPERRIGLSAHDFVQLASSPEAVLTRARRAGNAPTVPSRFLLQLETVLRALGHHNEEEDALTPSEPWDQWLRLLDEPEKITPCPKPEPRPPVSARPQQLVVTDIGTWRRNPYAIYARHILRLRKLDPIEGDTTAADKGRAIHAALEAFLRRFPDQLPPQALDALLQLGREAFAPYADQPHVPAFWWPRFERIAGWFVAEEHERRGRGIKVLQVEAEGTYTFENRFTLKGRADRIDRLPDGTLAILDYKTGGTPTQTDVKNGYEPQLPLLALIARSGGFKDIPTAAAGELAYWKLSGGAEAGETQTIDDAVGALVDAARSGFENLVTRFADPQMPYRAVPKAGLQSRYDDYAHLARLAEWGRTAEDT